MGRTWNESKCLVWTPLRLCRGIVCRKRSKKDIRYRPNVLVGVRIWEIFSKISSLKERALLANLLLRKTPLPWSLVSFSMPSSLLEQLFGDVNIFLLTETAKKKSSRLRSLFLIQHSLTITNIFFFLSSMRHFASIFIIHDWIYHHLITKDMWRSTSRLLCLNIDHILLIQYYNK